MEPIELALAGEEELPVGPVGQDEEGDRVQGEALQEQRLAEPFDDRRSIGQDLLVGVVPRDQAEIEVRVLVRFPLATDPLRNAATIRSSASQTSTKRAMTTL